MNTLKNIFGLILLLTSVSLTAQIPDDEVEVVKDFEARLIESEVIRSNPSLPPLDTTSRRLTYSIPSKSLNVDYPPPKIRPVAMPKERVPPTYKGYLKAGYGWPSSPYGELGYQTGSDKYEFGGYLKHHSANNTANIENQRFSESMVKLNGTYYLQEGLAVAPRVGYTLDEVYYYGYDQEVDTFSAESVRQRFRTIDFGVRLFNAERTRGDINYSAAINYYNMQDNFAVTENGVDIELLGTKWINELHPINVKIITDFTNLNDNFPGEQKQDLNNFYLQPNFTYHAEAFSIKGGINLVSHNDDFTVFPDAEVNVNVYGNLVAVYAGWRGDLQKNTLRTLSDYNPFILTRNVNAGRLLIENTSYNYIYGGLKGNLKVLDYQLEMGRKNTENLATYLNDPLDTTKFNVLYDDFNIFQIAGTVSAEPKKGLNVMANIGINIFNVAADTVPTLVEAWHLPTVTFNFTTSYLTLKDKLRLKAEIYTENGVPYLDRVNTEVANLNGLFDISLGAEYFFSKNFGLFLDLNNLANNKRQRWNNYPTFGFNILGGISARF